MNKILASGLTLTVAALFATTAMAAKDKFNRASLGSKWGIYSGNVYIVKNALQGDSLALGYYKKSKNDSSVTAKVIMNGTDLEYGAVAVGDIASGNNIFIKIQNQDGDNLFENAGFYVGNNGSVNFFALNTPVSSPAKLTASICGTVATMTIDSAEGEQVYEYDYGVSFPTGGGLGTYGVVSLDNYKSKTASCAAHVGAVKPIRITHSTAKDLSLAK